MFGDQRRHAGPAVGAWNGHTVDVGLLDAGKGTNRLGDFERRNILTLPAEGGADTIHEIEKAPRILAHQVTGADPDIARLEDVAENPLLRSLFAGVALESATDVGRVVQNLADGLADLVRSTSHAESVLVPRRLVLLDVELYQRRREAVREVR